MEQAHLLIVDDNEMNRDMLSRRVSREGYTFETAENGRQALEMLAQADFDLVLLDIMMPVMDGYQVLEQVKSDPALRHIPIIMISAIDEIENTARCIEMGADDYLPKPFNPTLLRARLSASLERKRLRDQEQRYARSLQRELEIGRSIQAGFLPETLPNYPGWELAAIFEPARLVAGDFYDAFALPNPGQLALVIADVCDKGVGAALFMALFRSLIRSNAASYFDGDLTTGEALVKTITQTNNYIAGTHSKANMFATIFSAVLDVSTGQLTYINAGHEPPLLLGANGARTFIAPTGPLVGALPEMVFESASLVLAPGDLLVCYTDGITEARNDSGEFFEDRALLELSQELTAQAALQQLHTQLLNFTTKAEQADDITLLALKRASSRRGG